MRQASVVLLTILIVSIAAVIPAPAPKDEPYKFGVQTWTLRNFDFDQVIAFAGKTVRDEDVVAALGLADRKLLYAVAEAIVDRDAARALELLNELHQFGHDLRRFARELLEHVRNLAVARFLPGSDLAADLPDEEKAEVDRQAIYRQHIELSREIRAHAHNGTRRKGAATTPEHPELAPRAIARSSG